MNRPTINSFILLLSLTLFATACGESSNPMKSTQPARRAEPAQRAEPAEGLPAGKAAGATTERANEVQIRASNLEGAGAWSPAVEVVLENAPPAPTIVGLRITSTPLHKPWYDQNEIIEIEVEFSEPVEVMATIRPYIWLRVDIPSNRMARYKHGTGTKRLFFRYTVNSEDFDANGIGVEDGYIQASDGDITAVSGGVPADLRHDGLPDDRDHKIDGCL